MNRIRVSLIVVATAAAMTVATNHRDPKAADGEPRRSVSAKPGQKLPQPIVDTHDLMELFNKPLYQYLKEAMNQEPADEKGWKTIEERGLQTAEVMNLVAIRELSGTSAEDWQRHVRTGQQAGLQLAKVAKTRNWNQTQEAYRGVIRNCNDCHQQVAPEEAPQIQP
jgi:hypothetical protein